MLEGRLAVVTGDGAASRSSVVRGLEAAGATVVAPGEGAVDVLVHLAGVDAPAAGAFASTEGDAVAEGLYASMMVPLLRTTAAVLPPMVERGSGSIVVVTSTEALRGSPGRAVWSAFHAAAQAFVRSLAVDVGRHGIRVNAVATPIAAVDVPNGRGRVEHWVPMARFGDADELADVVCFLASDRSRFVTGQVLAVDGGTLAAGGILRRSDGEDGWTNKPDRP